MMVVCLFSSFWVLVLQLRAGMLEEIKRSSTCEHGPDATFHIDIQLCIVYGWAGPMLPIGTNYQW